MLLYSLLHLSGFPISIEDLKDFRQFGSVTAGHPEREPHLGIETTTGPLGQGLGTSVGIAAAEAHLRGIFGSTLVDHRTYVFAGDGDLMEGISSEAGSLAGHLGLGRLTVVYDDNDISIGGSTDVTFSEDVVGRFRAFGWRTLEIDGHDRAAAAEALEDARSQEEQPTLIVAHTHIAHGAPTKQDTAGSHGSPLGEDEIAATREAMGWEHEAFFVPAEVRELFASAMEKGTAARRAWEQRRAEAFADRPEVAERWRRHFDPGPVRAEYPSWEPGDSMATRKASGAAFNAIAPGFPALVGGSADLEPSTNTLIDDGGELQRETPDGRNIRFGVREHAMGAMVNGMTLHGGVRAFGATFLVFNDYMRPAVRLSALMDVPSIWVYTHDSVFLGEDGPTHQPVEHLASLRAMPNMWVIRPADAGETAEAWEMALERTDGPTTLVLTRQGVPVLDRPAGAAKRGGYVVRDGDEAVLVATGSEVWVALEAAEILAGRDRRIRVVSLPSWEVFFEQDEDYRRSVLGDGLPVATLEAATTFGWDRIAGATGLRMGVDHFGTSAPWQRIAEEWGFTPEAVAERLASWLDAR
jgi:transketolase